MVTISNLGTPAFVIHLAYATMYYKCVCFRGKPPKNPRKMKGRIKMGKKQNVISLRLNEVEKAQLFKKAQDAQMSISTFLKKSALNTIIVKPNRNYMDLVSAVNRMGNNLNQIAKKVNTNEYIDKMPILEHLAIIELMLENLLMEQK